MSLDAALGACVRLTCPMLYLRVGPDERVLEANPHSLALLGPEVVGAPFAALVANFEAARGARQRCGGPPQQVNFLTRDALPLTLRCAFTPHGDEVLVLGIIDQAEQEALRRQLLHGTQSLAALTRELQRANALLEEAAALKTRFVGMAAHDLRSPLTTVLGAAQLLELTVSGPAREDVDTIRASAEFMAGLVDDFLCVALTDAGHLELTRRPVTLAALVQGAVRLTSPAARRRESTVALQLGALGELPLEVDVGRLQQALMNLLNNALEHSPVRSTVTVTADADQARVVVRVRDQGPGIAPEVQADLFKAFVHAGQKSLRERSLGLGLAIARLVVDAHGGSLTAESTPAGSTFTLSLPR